MVANEGAQNVMSVSLLRLNDGSIALFYLRKDGDDECRPYMRISNDEAVTWGPPVLCIPEPAGYYVVNNSRVVQMRSGRLLIPAALHALKGESLKQRARFCAGCRMTWARHGVPRTPCSSHRMLRPGFRSPVSWSYRRAAC